MLFAEYVECSCALKPHFVVNLYPLLVHGMIGIHLQGLGVLELHGDTMSVYTSPCPWQWLTELSDPHRS